MAEIEKFRYESVLGDSPLINKITTNKHPRPIAAAYNPLICPYLITSLDTFQELV